MSNVLLLGTKNRGKIDEMRALLRDLGPLEILTAGERLFADVDETGATFLENALLKARAVACETGLAVLAEDAGLEVLALGGAPGVRSARYAGEPANPARNNALLLEALRGIVDRRARFVAVAAVALPDGRTFTAAGALEGTIADGPHGGEGFGYDPLFVPRGETRTLAEMAADEKNAISHRRHAIEALRPVLQRLLADGALAEASRPRLL